jgi:hypothetical protein
MAVDPTKEFTATDDAALEQAAETPIEPVEGQGEKSDAAAEKAAGDKMAEILARNDAKNQADELDEEGITGPDNPDGDKPETDAAGAKAKEEAEGEDEGEGDGGGETAPTAEELAAKKVVDEFDPNLKRVAAELGNWKQKDIEDFIVANPTLARITFSNMAAGFNNLSLQYAQGARGPAQPGPQQQQQTVATQPNLSALDELLAKPEKLKALQEIAGEELTNLFIKPMLEERRQQNEDRQFVASLRRDALVREINDSFTDLAKGGFEDFYGKNGEVTQDQTNNRFKTGQLADQIRAGAQMQGVSMGINEALKRAHLIVTADQTRATVRKEITQQVKKRSTQITARPTARAEKVSVGGGQRSDDTAIAAVEQFWAERA